MQLQRLLLLAALLVAALAGRVHAAATGSRWTTGLDLTLDAAAGLRGGAETGRTLHGGALARIGWEQVETADRTVRYRACASALTLAGHGPTGRWLGDFLTASNIEGHPGTRLYACWFEANLGAWSLRGGTLLADEEFTGTASGGNFLNSAFGWPAFISANTINTGPAFFVPAPGLRLQRSFGESAAARLGVYDGDTFDSPAGDPGVNRHGLHHRLGGAQGWFAIGEIAASFGATRLKAGAWLHTATFADVRLDATGRPLADTGATPRVHPHNHGAYAAVERTLAGKAGEAGHMEIHARGGFAPPDRNTLGWALDTGFAWTGPLPGRSADVAALGFVHAAFSPRYAAQAHAADPVAAKPDHEQVVEVSYTAALTKTFTLQPDLQFIRHPGGSAATRDAVAFLLRCKASY